MIKKIYRLGIAIARRLDLYEERNKAYTRYIVEDLELGKILDIGCGSGKLTKLIYLEAVRRSGKPLELIALDIDCGSLENLRNTAVNPVCGDAENIPLRSNSIETAVSISLLEHLRNPEKHLEEVARVLVGGGRLIIQIPNLDYYIEPHTKFPMIASQTR